MGSTEVTYTKNVRVPSSKPDSVIYTTNKRISNKEIKMKIII